MLILVSTGYVQNKAMRRTNLIILFLVFITCAADLRAQTNFLRGYYITLEQDTIHGYIGYGAEIKLYKGCMFKTDLESPSRRISPENALGFVVGNQDFYERHIVDNEEEARPFFFRVLIRGKLSLLRYRSRYFAKDLTGTVFEVTRKSEVVGGQVRNDYSGLGLLKTHMDDCEELGAGFLENEYGKKGVPDYVGIFRTYNSCLGGKVVESADISIKPHVGLAFQLMPTFTRVTLTTPHGPAHSEWMYGSVGAVASIFIPKTFEHLRIQVEVNYQKGSLYVYQDGLNQKSDFFVDVSALKTPVLIRYGRKVFVEVGVQSQWLLGQNLRWRVETIRQQVIDGELRKVVEAEFREIDPLDVNMTGYIGGLGVKSKISRYPVTASVRVSEIRSPEHSNEWVFQSVELSFSLQLR